MSVVVREKIHPEVPVPEQSAVIPQKKKSVPEVPMLGLKNSVIGEHRERVELRIWVEVEAEEFILTPVNPNRYRHGVVSAAPVPQTNRYPLAGLL